MSHAFPNHEVDSGCSFSEPSFISLKAEKAFGLLLISSNAENTLGAGASAGAAGADGAGTELVPLNAENVSDGDAALFISANAPKGLDVPIRFV